MISVLSKDTSLKFTYLFFTASRNNIQKLHGVLRLFAKQIPTHCIAHTVFLLLFSFSFANTFKVTNYKIAVWKHNEMLFSVRGSNIKKEWIKYYKIYLVTDIYST